MKRNLLIVIAILVTIITDINAQTWSSVGTGLNSSPIYDFTVYNGELYVGGIFTTAGGVSANNIAKWDGVTWSAVGTGTNGSVGALTVYNGELYVGGSFTTAGGISANRIAKWNGATWSVVGSGLDLGIADMYVYNSELYVGGNFHNAGGISADNVAKWNGTTWSAVGGSVNLAVKSFCEYNGLLYMGGDFTSAGGNSANYIAKWDGATWSAVGSGMGQTVSSLIVYNSEMYAGGVFTTAGGITANRVAKYDGTNWSALGTGMDGWVTSVYAYKDKIYAGGAFLTSDGITTNHISVWDGTSWSAIGSGTNDIVFCLISYKNDLYIGGDYTTANGVATNYIAKLSMPCDITITSQPTNSSPFKGDPTSFSVSATGTSLTYKWQEDNGSGFSDISSNCTFSNEATNSLNIATVTSSLNNSKYRCIVSTANCSDTSDVATLTINGYVPTDGLVGYYPFSGNADDGSGNSNNGTVTGATLTTDRFGNGNSAYYFNGSSNILALIPTNYAPSASSFYSFSLWFKTDTFATSKAILTYKGGQNAINTSNYDIFSSHSGCNPKTIAVQNYPFNNPSTCSPSTMDTDFWTHLYIVFDQVSHSFQVYKNSQFWFDGLIGNSPPLSGYLNFGNNSTGGFGFNGKIDDIRIYNRALSDSEVTSLFNENISFQTVYDTITTEVFDTTHVVVNDTNIINITHHDTIFNQIPIMDTVLVTVHDTIHTTITTKISVTDTLLISVNLTGINPPSNTAKILVYPNPSLDKITIDVGNYTIMTGYSMKITNTLGQEVWKSNITVASYNLDLNTFGGKGTYFITIIDNQSAILDVRKIILE